MRLKKQENKLSEDVSKLETEKSQVLKKINLIDSNLEAIKGKIETEKVNHDVENPNVDTELNDDVRKQCKFNRRGYCRQQNDCEFFHSNKICEIYLDKGTCWKQDCRLRHPKPCRYGNWCFRGKSCLYLHSTSSCDRCENFSRNLYFC